ncbi:MAG TPA: cation diffusion facilitator family transporter [Solirubrobacteraceae bacterium]
MGQTKHSHSHGHAHFDAASAEGSRSRLYATLALILGLMAAELAVGVVAHSLALLSDAGHMLTDAAAIALSLLALRLAARPARGVLTFGLRRVEILSAQANGVTLVVLAGFVTYEAIHRLVDPPHVRAGLVLALALVGALVNLAASAILAGADRRSLNIEGSFQHILTDLFGFLGTAVAAGVILATGFRRADPIVSLLIAGLMVRSGTGLLLASGRVFLEAAPEGLDPEAIGRALVAEPGVIEVHDLHVWEVTSGFPALSAHVLVGTDSDCHAARRAMEAMLHERFGLEHTTLQVDHEGGDLLKIAPIGARGGDS